MALFERYVAIDWSAAATPTTGSNSIWCADRRSRGEVDLVNHPTRHRAMEALDAIIGSGERTLVGVDASLGYPRGTAAMFGLTGQPWSAMWSAIAEVVTDDERNRNNRFAAAACLNERAGDEPGPFWGCPTESLAPALERTKPVSFGVGEFREVESRLRRSGLYPKSVWQLLGAGSVGSQTLTLIPRLREQLADVEVWPFTSGLGVPQPSSDAVVAEIWPTRFAGEVPAGMVPDAAQVVATVDALASADADGRLAEWFSPSVDDEAAVRDEEGWILGVV